MSRAWQRTTEEVLHEHLRRREAGDLEGDLRENYHEEVRLLSAEGEHHGHDGVRKVAGMLRTYQPEGAYRYKQALASGDVAMLVWSGRCAATDREVYDGVDSLVIRDGWIVAQTVHCTIGAWT